ncbi:MAG TPA: CDGSH iron-sulfur domain-containing protein [Steroidobacteraceae bacterium]|nr:CDGSH iron-sulfur domain-containing protein [Steroidobacteraceae bacterium]
MADAAGMKIVVTENGPYRVTGSVSLSKQIIEPNAEGESWEWREGEQYAPRAAYSLCRCGQSQHKPFCDSTHLKVGFDGAETASRAPYLEQAQEFDGPEMTLTDAQPLCAYARFCDPKGQIWNLIDQTDTQDGRDLVKREAGNCPSGRLVAWDKLMKQAIEPALDPSIGLVEDPHLGVSGPIWVRGGIPVESADGTPYEVRNRQTLCRCGASSNKPFCDGSHASIGFTDAG